MDIIVREGRLLGRPSPFQMDYNETLPATEAPASKTTDIKSLGLDDLRRELSTGGSEEYRSRQIARWLYKTPVASFEDMSNIAKKVRADLAQRFHISQPEVVEVQRSADGTRKVLSKLEDNRKIETVIIPKPDRLTLCISTQVGCGMACAFCRTATMGLVRNLTVGEILNQIVAARAHLDPGETVTNLVFMGMGEPLHNVANVQKAVELLVSDDAFGLAPRRITVSTVGHVPGIKKLGELGFKASLAVSLNATTDEVRDKIMPVNRRYPIAVLLDTLRAFPLGPKGKITIEYVMLKGINDSLEDARRLMRLLANLPNKINLIQYNPWPGTPYEPSSTETINRFHLALADKGFFSRLRNSRGPDILAACGQLATARQ